MFFGLYTCIYIYVLAVLNILGLGNDVRHQQRLFTNVNVFTTPSKKKIYSNYTVVFTQRPKEEEILSKNIPTYI